MYLGNGLNLLRRIYDKPASVVAKELKVSGAFYAKLELGKKEVHPDQVKIIAKLYGIRPSEVRVFNRMAQMSPRRIVRKLNEIRLKKKKKVNTETATFQWKAVDNENLYDAFAIFEKENKVEKDILDLKLGDLPFAKKVRDKLPPWMRDIINEIINHKKTEA